ncbi:MAG: hypothetical protein M9965_15630 [Anaerolineae bacterium]|nr:hypothetical protein [Anaerolineae bacterium]
MKSESRNAPRTVYTITQVGQAEFTRLLQERLAEFRPIEYPDGISLNFVHTLEPEVAIPLLEQCASRLADRCADLEGFSDDIRASHPGLDFLIRQVGIRTILFARINRETQEETQQ